MNRSRRGLAMSVLASGLSIGCSGSIERLGSGSGDAGQDATSSGSGDGGASDEGGDASWSGAVFTDAGVPFCGTTPCDLKSNTCCATPSADGTCVPKSQTCPTGTASFGCLQASDCAAGQVCCGSVATNSLLGATACQTGGCGPGSLVGPAQLCQSTAECSNGTPCIAQTCSTFVAGGKVLAQLKLCGLEESCTPAPCSPPGSTRCSGDGVRVETCSSTGAWETGVACTNQACASGACTGVCTPGATQCSGNGVQTCDSTGVWGTTVACASLACASGVCVSVCAPGATQCSSNGVQTCVSTSTWGTAAACTNQACVSGACTGVCTPGATQCSGNGVQTCDSTGSWGAAVACPSSCTCVGGLCQTIAAQSCAPGGSGLTNCGAVSESCCTSVEVPGGRYDRTYEDSAGVFPLGGDLATVSGFRLDKYLVTVGRFRRFVNAVLPPDGGAGWQPPPGSGRHTHLNGGNGLGDGSTSPDAGLVYEPGWLASYNQYVAPTNANLACDATYPTWTPSAGSQESLPINCVNWWESYAFCIWDGGFLPSEAEWEYAAAGGSQQREYPWGSATPGTTNQYAIYGSSLTDCYYPTGTVAACTGIANIAPVGTAPAGAGLWGQLDLAGELWEWTLDTGALSVGGNPMATYVDPCFDCAYLAPAPGRVMRGGIFDDSQLYLLPAGTYNAAPTQRSYGGGIRCARSP